MVSVKVYFQLSAIYHFLLDIFVYRGSNLRLLVPILLLNLKEINHTLLNIHIWLYILCCFFDKHYRDSSCLLSTMYLIFLILYQKLQTKLLQQQLLLVCVCGLWWEMQILSYRMGLIIIILFICFDDKKNWNVGGVGSWKLQRRQNKEYKPIQNYVFELIYIMFQI